MWRGCATHCRVPVTFFLLAQNESHQRKRASPVRRRDLVNSCGSPALLDQPGGLRNSRQGIVPITIRAGDVYGTADLIEARPVLADAADQAWITCWRRAI
jgi:hypothetical protein